MCGMREQPLWPTQDKGAWLQIHLITLPQGASFLNVRSSEHLHSAPSLLCAFGCSTWMLGQSLKCLHVSRMTRGLFVAPKRLALCRNQKTPQQWVTLSSQSQNSEGRDFTSIYPKLRLNHDKPNNCITDSLSTSFNHIHLVTQHL